MAGPLVGQVALVAGATRAAGRGIARELAAAGAKVWCSGRSVRGAPATEGRPETIEETAELIEAAGGQAVAARTDHTKETEVEALVARIAAEDGRLDIVVNDIWGGDELVSWAAPFWKDNLANMRVLIERAVLSHWITARYAAPMMVEAKRGLIVEVTDGEAPGYRGNLTYDVCKATVNRLAYGMAWDLAQTGVTALALSPGFLRSEAMLDRFGVTEANWREGVAQDPAFAFSETPHFVGRGVAALAGDPKVRAKSGAALCVGDLAQEYGFTDLDGSRPHFWEAMDAQLRAALASDAPLDAGQTFLASARYMRSHLDPNEVEMSRALAAKLGWERLPAGLAVPAPPPQ